MRATTEFPTDATAIVPENPEVLAEQRRRAIRVVASAAHDAEDCARLLDALGLEPAEGRGSG